MSYYPPQQTVIVNQPASNSLGVVGFCLTVLGWLTCGVLCVPSLIVCGIAMFREPRGLAIAGFILSIPGVIGMAIAMVMFLSAGAAVSTVANEAAKIKSAQDASKQSSGGLDALKGMPKSNKPLPASGESTLSPR